jgi:hypothetical protein
VVLAVVSAVLVADQRLLMMHMRLMIHMVKRSCMVCAGCLTVHDVTAAASQLRTLQHPAGAQATAVDITRNHLPWLMCAMLAPQGKLAKHAIQLRQTRTQAAHHLEPDHQIPSIQCGSYFQPQ